MYRKVSTDMNFVDREKSVLEFWKQNDIIKKSFHHRDGAEPNDDLTIMCLKVS